MRNPLRHGLNGCMVSGRASSAEKRTYAGTRSDVKKQRTIFIGMSAIVWITVLNTFGATIILAGLIGLCRSARQQLITAKRLLESEQNIGAAVISASESIQTMQLDDGDKVTVHNLLNNVVNAARTYAGLPLTTASQNDLSGSRSYLTLAKTLWRAAWVNLTYVGIGTICTTVASIWSATSGTAL